MHVSMTRMRHIGTGRTVLQGAPKHTQSVPCTLCTLYSVQGTEQVFMHSKQKHIGLSSKPEMRK